MLKAKEYILFLFGSVFGIIIMLMAFGFYFFIYWVNGNSGLITFLSVLVAITIFLFTWFWDKYKHRKNQYKILRSLIGEINALTGKRTFGTISMGPHLQWLQDHKVTDHLAHEIDANFYSRNLDYKIDDKRTDEIISALRMIQDKIDLVNYYAAKQREKLYNLWTQERRIDDFNLWQKQIDDRLNNVLHGKKLQAIREAWILLESLQRLINERFNVR